MLKVIFRGKEKKNHQVAKDYDPYKIIDNSVRAVKFLFKVKYSQSHGLVFLF